MKANEAPEKLYLSKNIYSTYLYQVPDPDDDTTVEYTRTDTFEVKGVDLEKELDKEWNKCEPIDEGMGLEIASIEHEQFDNIAKHFFELGIKAKGE